VASQRIDLDVIRDIDLYRIEPWDLQGIYTLQLLANSSRSSPFSCIIYIFCVILINCVPIYVYIFAANK
jgi:hypothetical protein